MHRNVADPGSYGCKPYRVLIIDTMARLEAATGARPKGWLSIARQQSFHTLDLLKQAGVRYCCDWVNDESHYKFSNGVTALPIHLTPYIIGLRYRIGALEESLTTLKTRSEA